MDEKVESIIVTDHFHNNTGQLTSLALIEEMLLQQ